MSKQNPNPASRPRPPLRSSLSAAAVVVWSGVYMGAIGRLFVAVTSVVIFFTCAPRMGMTVDAPDVQTGGVDSGPTALMRQAYRDGRYETVIKEFEALNVPGVPDSVKHSAAYLTGLALLRRCGADSVGCDLNVPLRYFETIPDSHPDYVFARNAMADICYTQDINDKRCICRDYVECTIENLKRAIRVKPKNKAQAEAVNRAYVFLCFRDYGKSTYYYWGSELDSAAKNLRKVPSGSSHYTDAQLGLGWVSMPRHKYDDAISAGAEAVNSTDDLFLQSDAYFLSACASVFKKDYDKALSLLDTASRKLASYIAPDGSETAVRRNEYNEYEGKLMYSRDIEYVRENIKLASILLPKLAERHRINEEIERQKRTADSLDRPETTDTLRLIPKKMDTKIYADEKHERVIATVDPRSDVVVVSEPNEKHTKVITAPSGVLTVLETTRKHYKARTADGTVGYVLKNALKKNKPRKLPKPEHCKHMDIHGEDDVIILTHPSDGTHFIFDIDDPTGDVIALPGDHFTGRKPPIENGY